MEHGSRDLVVWDDSTEDLRDKDGMVVGMLLVLGLGE